MIQKPVDISVFVTPNDENDTVKLADNVDTVNNVSAEESWWYLVSLRSI